MRRLHALSRVCALLATIATILALIPARPLSAATDFRWENPQISLTQTLQSPRPTSIVVTFKLINDLASDATFQISYPDLPGGWTARTGSGNTVVVPAAKTASVAIRIDIPDNASAGRRTITIRASRTVPASSAFEDAFLDLTLVPVVPAPAPEGACPEPSDPGGDQDSAALILVDKEEGHGICSRGDEDWYKFGALAGKYYTIDIPVQDKGLDLALELYDEDGRLVDANDDFPRSTEVLTDTRPRIQSFRAPTSGFFYFRVRDTLGIGGANLGYRVVVMGESYGQDPPPVASICNDRYEPDGLPEQAYPIKPNETHRAHRLCPVGDADWVKFFGLAGYTYYVFTRTAPGTDGNPLPGADTILFIFSRDGQTLIDANNNIATANNLDSALAFRPSADGIYYAQVKNVGDIGNMFIEYDLTVKACPSEQVSCKGPADLFPEPGAPPPPPVSSAPSSAPPAAQPPAAPPAFLDSEAPPEEDTSASILTPVSLGTASTIDQDPPNVPAIPPIFERLWRRVDLPVANGRVSRAWLWGPTVRLNRTEAYVETPTGLRQVLYYDKGRMELAAPASTRVTSGLLVHELISGQLQVGDTQFSQRSPSDIAMVGDLDDPRAPTYASLSGLIGPVQDRTGQTPSEALDRSGSVGSYSGTPGTETRLVRFIPQTGHNIPSVFWEYLHTRGTIYDGAYRTGQLFDWLSVVGYPISEPYWTRVYVGGIERDVLVQAFERRTLTYVPDEKPAWRVQLGNVGQHYYRWRYGEDLP